MGRSGPLTKPRKQTPPLETLPLETLRRREDWAASKKKWRTQKKQHREAKTQLDQTLKTAPPLKPLGDLLEEDKQLHSIDDIALNLRLAAAVRKVIITNRQANKQSWITTSLVAELSKEAAFTAAQTGKFFDMTTSQAHNVRNRGDDWKEIAKIARESKPPRKEPRLDTEERRLTRMYVRSVCKAVSNSEQYRCFLSRNQLYIDYVVVGAPSIYWSMLDLPSFKKKADNFDPSSKNPQKQKGLSQSLYYTQEWASKGFDTPRPAGIWARSKRTFFKVLNERYKVEQGKRAAKKKLNLIFSYKPHPCPVCDTFRPTLKTYNILSALLKEVETEHDRKSIQGRLGPIQAHLRILKEHLDKYRAQRGELRLLEKTTIPPGTVLVYEDFCSCYQADGNKMANLILTLVYYENGQKRIEYYDTFSSGSQTVDQLGDPDKRGKQDKYMYREVWLNHLNNGVFKRFHTIIKSGDNGGSLKNYDTFYFSSMIWETYQIRVLWFTLCPHHAYNLCDPHGGRNKDLFLALEREKGGALGTPEQHAAAVNAKKFKDTKTAQVVYVNRKPDKTYMPPGDFQKKKSDVFGIQSICVTFPEVPNIHELSANPGTSIRWPGLGMVTNTLGSEGVDSQRDIHPDDSKRNLGGGDGVDSKQNIHSSHGVAVLDIRLAKYPGKKKCIPCSDVFGYNVLEEEHDQRDHWLCPKSKIYAHETKLSRYCDFCKGTVSDNHRRGTEYKCPTEGKNLQNIHLTFNALKMDGTHQQLKILHARPEPPSGNALKDFVKDFETYLEPQDLGELGGGSKANVEKNMFVIWKRKNSKNQAVLPWVLGKCHKIDNNARKYTMRVYEPKSEPSSRVALWDCPFKHTNEEVSIDFDTRLYYPVKRSKKKISTRDIIQLAQSRHYGWKLEDLCATPKPIRRKQIVIDEEKKVDKEKHMIKFPVEETKETQEDQAEFQAYLKEPEADDIEDTETSLWDGTAVIQDD